jgi:hypothetical protein
VTFTASNVAGDEITSVNHGLNTGDEVVYSAQNGPLGGLDNGGVYYVIRIDADHFELADSYADALAGNAIALGQGLAASGDQQTVERLTNVGVPSVSTPNFSAPTLANNTEGAPTTTSRSGVAVVAVSANHLTSPGAAGGGAGSVAVQVAGAVEVDTINTQAYIDTGAQTDQNDGGAASGQSVSVDAGRGYQDLTLGIGASFAGSVGISPAISVPVLEGTTSATINGGASSAGETRVSANQDVEVVATAQASFIAIAVGAAIAGDAGIAGSGSAIVVNTTTEAEIDG